MKKNFSLFIFALLSGTAISQAPSTLTLDGNNVSATLSDAGILFAEFDNQFLDQTIGTLNYSLGGNSGLNDIGSLSMWFGGRDEFGQPHISTPRYTADEYVFKGPLSLTGEPVGEMVPAIFPVTRAEIDHHIANVGTAGYQAPQNILLWPAHGDVSFNASFYLAPFVDVNGDQIYTPYEGDYPCVLGDETVYIITNDVSHGPWCGVNNMDGLGIEMHTMVYQYYDEAVANTTFIQTKAVNRSLENYTSFNAGIFFDGLIGNVGNDFAGTSIDQNMMFNYNGTASDIVQGQIGYGDTPPATGVISLNKDITSTRLFRSSANYPEGMPSYPPEFMHVLEGSGVDGSTLGPTFAFTGNPYTNTGNLDSLQFDSQRSQLMRFEIGEFSSHDTVTFDFAIVTALGEDHLESVNELYQAADEVQNFYDGLVESCLPPVLSLGEEIIDETLITLYPNPVIKTLEIKAPKEFVRAKVINSIGKELLTTEETTLDVSELPKGVYLIELDFGFTHIVKRFVKK
ncbi:MAG: T9SS type A sorting domain-containing protein [Crocinitomicaceae bacterium]|nr:T9SS type A sorting domain-containing protein [Crocinitomicaceae bacterium]